MWIYYILPPKVLFTGCFLLVMFAVVNSTDFSDAGFFWPEIPFEQDPDCPDGFEKLNRQMCYKYFHEKVGFNEAVDACGSQNGTLAEPRDLGENSNVKQIFKEGLENETDKTYQLWLGASKNQAGVFVWNTYADMVIWTDWVMGAPPYKPCQGQECEYCLQMKQYQKGTEKKLGWDVANCDSHKNAYVCQANTKDYWIPSNGKEYKILPEETAAGVYTASVLCDQEDALLPEPRDVEENNFLSKYTRDSEAFYLGMQDDNADNVWRWDRPRSKVEWLNWAQSPPLNTNDKCAMMKPGTGKWSAGTCEGGTDKKSIVCQRMDTEPCHPGFTLKGKYCYKYFKREKSVEQATAYCKEINQEIFLARPNSEDEDTMLDTIVEKQSPEAKEVWLGVNTTEAAKQFVYKAWTTGYPKGSGKCVLKTLKKGWTNEECFMDHPFICQHLRGTGPKELVIQTDTTKQDAHDCPEEFEAHGKACYKYMKNKTSYSAAKDDCTHMDAFLAEPRNSEENDVIKEMHARYSSLEALLWLGANDEKKEGDFVWSTFGDMVMYTDFVLGEPNNGENDEDCVGFKRFKVGEEIVTGWSDNQCEEKSASICQVNLKDYWIPSYGKTFQVINGAIVNQIQDARVQCDKMEAILPEPEELAESTFLSKLSSSQFYLGLSDGKTEGEWLWGSDGSKVTWTNWRPEKKERRTKCAVMTGQPGLWAKIPCTNGTAKAVVCQGTTDRTCPAGYTVSGKYCYKYSDKKLSFKAAIAACKDMKADLAEPKIEREDDYLEDLMDKQKVDQVWIGAEYSDKKFQWKTRVAELSKERSYTAWIHGHPSAAGTGKCVYKQREKGWADDSCDVTRTFFCQKIRSAPIQIRKDRKSGNPASKKKSGKKSGAGQLRHGSLLELLAATVLTGAVGAGRGCVVRNVIY